LGRGRIGPQGEKSKRKEKSQKRGFRRTLLAEKKRRKTRDEMRKEGEGCRLFFAASRAKNSIHAAARRRKKEVKKVLHTFNREAEGKIIHK